MSLKIALAVILFKQDMKMTRIGENMAWNVIICGAGNRGMEHALAIQNNKGEKLVGFFDPSSEARQNAEKIIPAPAYARLEDLLSEHAPQIAVIASPPQVRRVLVDELLASQDLRAIIIEKPIALHFEEALEIIRKCKERHILLLAGCQLPFSKEFKSLKQAIENGNIGKLQSLQAFCYGNLSDQGIHMIDAMLWLANSKAAWVSAKQGNDLKLLTRWIRLQPDFKYNNPHPAPLWVDITIGFESGLQATLGAGLLAPIPKPELGNWLQKRIVAIGSEGIAEAHVASHFKFLASDSSGWKIVESDLTTYRMATELLHCDLIEKLNTSDMGTFQIDRALHGVEIMNACFQSILTGDLTAIPISASSKPIKDWQQSMQDTTSNDQTTRENIGLDTKPLVSVILPMEDHRGLGLQSLESWTQYQRCNAEDFELIILLNGVDDKLAKAMQQRLRSGDRAINQIASTEMEAYDIGAREAKGKYLFFTEPHCIAEPEAVTQIIHFFQTKSNLDGFCARSMPIIRNSIGKMEMQMYEKGFVDWSKEDHWVKVILRGFGIRRESYLNAGGYDFKYDRFSEWLLAATLHHKGYRLGYAPGVGVHHLYSDSFSLLAPFIKSFTEGECFYRLTGDQDIIHQYFDTPFEWVEAQSINRVLARDVLKTLLTHLFWKKPGAMLTVKDGLQAIARLLPMAVIGKYSLFLRVWARVVWAQLRFWLATNEKQKYQAFEDWYTLKTSYYRIQYAIEHPSILQTQIAKEYDVKQMNDQQVFGFFPLEMYQGCQFRWASPVAAIQVGLEANCGYEGIVQLHQPRDFANEKTPSFYFNGKHLDAKFDPQMRQYKFFLKKEQVQASDIESQLLVLLSGPWSASKMNGDSRHLGMPIISLRFEPANSG